MGHSLSRLPALPSLSFATHTKGSPVGSPAHHSVRPILRSDTRGPQNMHQLDSHSKISSYLLPTYAVDAMIPCMYPFLVCIPSLYSVSASWRLQRQACQRANMGDSEVNLTCSIPVFLCCRNCQREKTSMALWQPALLQRSLGMKM